MNTRLNDGVYQEWKKNICFGLQRPSLGFDNFLAKRVLYNMPKPRGDVEAYYIKLFQQESCQT